MGGQIDRVREREGGGDGERESSIRHTLELLQKR